MIYFGLLFAALLQAATGNYVGAFFAIAVCVILRLFTATSDR